MKTTADELTRQVALAARKVRMAQIGFADDPEDRRAAYLVELIEQLAAEVVPARRDEFLSRLMDEFPVWDAAFKAPASTDLPPETTASLVTRLIERAETMSVEQRRDLMQRLQAAGVLPDAPETGDDTSRSATVLSKQAEKACQYVMRELGIDDLDLVRTLKLVVMLCLFVNSGDAVIWKLWKLIAPRSAVKRTCDLSREIARYAAGDKGVSGIELKANLDHLQNMVMWLLAAIGQAGTEVAHTHLTRFAPMSIQTEANKEGGFGLEMRCWKRYQAMAHDLEADVMDFAFREAIVRRVEQFMKTKQR